MTGKRRRPQRALVARGRLVVVAAALLVGALVWGAGRVQLKMADGARHRQLAVQELLTSMLDQETGVRGFLLTGEDEFLQPARAGARDYGGALTRARASIDGGDARAALERSEARAAAWRRSA